MESRDYNRLSRYLKAQKKGFYTRIESPSSPGFPDLLIFYKGQVAFIELKSTTIMRKTSRALTHKMSPHQLLYAKRLGAEGLKSYVLLFGIFGVILLESNVVDKLNSMTWKEAEDASKWKCLIGFSGLLEAIFER